MPAIVVGTADRTFHLELEHADGFPFDGSVAALEQALAASHAHPDATDVWLFGATGEAPWHAAVALPPKGNRAKKTS